jgi:hypothetical protein
MEYDITVTRTWSEVGVIRVTAASKEEAKRGLEEYFDTLDGAYSDGIEFDPDSLSIDDYEIETVVAVGPVVPKRSVAEILAQ